MGEEFRAALDPDPPAFRGTLPQAPEEREQVNARSPALAVHITLLHCPCVMMSYSCR